MARQHTLLEVSLQLIGWLQSEFGVEHKTGVYEEKNR